MNKIKKRHPLSEEHKRKISEGVKKHLPSTTFSKGFTPYNKGKKGCVNSGSFKKGHPCLNNIFHKGHIIKNTGRTHFKKGEHLREEHPNWKGGKYKSKGYIFLYQPYHPYAKDGKYVSEHRLIVEKQIGRFLLPSEKVHHLGKKDNNSPKMLMAFISHSSHIRFEKGSKVKPSEIIFDGRKLHNTNP